MDEEKKDEKLLQEEREKIKAETEAQMLRARVNDYIAIALALGAVFLLWILQMMGLY
jgi:thiamine monophosphate synthase